MDSIKLEKLADLVYKVSSATEALDSDLVYQFTKDSDLVALWSDLDYIRGFISEAVIIIREMRQN